MYDAKIVNIRSIILLCIVFVRIGAKNMMGSVMRIGSVLTVKGGEVG